MADAAAPRRPLVLGPHDPRNRRSLVTPEGVDLALGLASTGQRISAFLIDLLIMGFTLIVLTVIIIVGALPMGIDNEGAAVLELLGVLWLLGFFVIRNGYFILFEAGTRAATFGKRGTGLRVAARSGERLTTESVIARNLMREVEVFLPISYLAYSMGEGGSDPVLGWLGALWVLLFLLFPLFNKDRLRVGDILAGTWVVMIPKQHLSYDLAAHQPPVAESEGPFTAEQLDAYGVYELQTLEQVLRDFNPDAMRMVADTIRTKIGYWGPGDSHEFLAAYYAAARARMERGLLFGKRRADKFDRGD